MRPRKTKSTTYSFIPAKDVQVTLECFHCGVWVEVPLTDLNGTPHRCLQHDCGENPQLTAYTAAVTLTEPVRVL